MTTPTTNTLRAMVAIAEGFIIAVGDGGIILQYDGTTWTSLVSPTTSSLRGVWGSSPINIYAVGDGGVVLHYLP